MAERVFIGNDGANFRFRVSRPGFDARTAPVQQLAIHEEMEALHPYEQGLVTVNGGASVLRTLTGTYTLPPFIVIRCDKNYLPGGRSFYAEFTPATPSIRIYNRMSEVLVVKYCIFGERPE